MRRPRPPEGRRRRSRRKPKVRSAQSAGVVTAFSWCRTLVRRILITRTPFSRYLLAALSVTKWDSEPTTGLFPLPLPFPGAVARPGALLRRRRRLHWVQARSIAVNVLAVALNHVYEGVASWPHLQALRR